VDDFQEEENTAHPDQDHPRQLLGPFTKLLPQATAQPYAELRRDECLNADPEHRDGERDAQEPEAKADGQLIETDAQSKVDDGNSLSLRQEAKALPLLLLLLTRPKHQDAHENQHGDGRISSEPSHRRTDRGSDKNAHDWHRSLEAGEDQAGPTPDLRRDAGDPERSSKRERIEGEGDKQPNQREGVLANRSQSSPATSAPAWPSASGLTSRILKGLNLPEAKLAASCPPRFHI
jgi:hypothetical protein